MEIRRLAETHFEHEKIRLERQNVAQLRAAKKIRDEQVALQQDEE